MNLRRLISWQPLAPAAFFAAVALALILVSAIVIGVMRHNARVAAETKVGAAMSEAHTQSASEAANIIDRGGTRDAATDDITRENANAIDRAPGAGQAVDPGVHSAGLHSLCQRSANRGRPECVQLLGPIELPKAGSRR